MPASHRLRIRTCLKRVLIVLSCLLSPGAAVATHPVRPEPPVAQHLPLHRSTSGLLYLPPGADGHVALPVVILLGDAGGQDGRASLYTLRLLSAGFAVLDADFAESALNDGGSLLPETVPLAIRLPLALDALRSVEMADPMRIAALGIGEGGRAVMASPRDTLRGLAAAVLVYPGCDDALAAQAARQARRAGDGQVPILLVHGEFDAEAMAGCPGLEAALGGDATGATRMVVQGAGYGWDAEAGDGRRVMLQDATDPDRHRQAHPDNRRALMALDRMLLFMIRAMEMRSR